MSPERLSPPSLGVVYLARCADGIDAFRRFARSYRSHPAGRDHELIVIYKGFDQQAALNAARAVFKDLPHQGIELADTGFDIGSYLETSRRVPHEILCFLNTHTELITAGWLAGLAELAAREGVGVAGVMGSYESLFDSILLMRHARWAEDYRQPAPLHQSLAFYYDFLELRAGRDPARISRTALMPRLPPAVRKLVRFPWYRWKSLARLWPGAQLIDIRQFPSFPNPHLRTNGFAIRREQLRRFDAQPIASKSDANVFESGRSGMTATLRRAGLATLVVGRDGRAYDVPDWPKSLTFRQGEQQNLLLTDNQARAFAAMSPGARATHCRITWGDYLGPAPLEFPDLGFTFRANPLPRSKAAREIAAHGR